MIPIEPDIAIPEGWSRVVFAEHQKEYLPLPAIFEHASEGHLITRWKLSWRERVRILFNGDLWFMTMTFHKPLQPIMLDINPPKFQVNE